MTTPNGLAALELHRGNRKGVVLSVEHRAKLSASTKGRPKSDETRARMSAAARQRTLEHRAKLGRPGEANPSWKGDEVSYMGAHARARKALAGEPCLACGSFTDIDAALINGCASKAGPGSQRYLLRFSSDPADYLPLCSSCHVIYDMASK